MFGVVFELKFISDCFLNGKNFEPGELAYFQVLLEASSIPEAYNKACDYSRENYHDAEVRVVTISAVSKDMFSYLSQ